MLFTAGEKFNDIEKPYAPKYIQPQFNLKDICRRRIREHLLEVDPHTHLFSRVPKLEIPYTLHDYLLYDQKLDDRDFEYFTSDGSDDDDYYYFDDDDDDDSSI